MTRHLVGLIDGTMVSASNVSAYGSYSNVFELACLLQLRDKSEDGSPQIVFYTSGISSRPDSWSPYNLLTGNSIWSQIIDQYINICSNYDFDAAADGRPDKIYLFGFSRGAMAVRALASLIAEFGLLKPADVRDFPVILDAWDKSIGKGNLPDSVRVVNAEVEFVGLFDSVMGGWEKLRVFNPVRFRDFRLPPRCRQAVQLLAIDENRRHFQPKFWDGIAARETDSEFEATRMLRQVWMPGVHSDVGGTGNPIWGRAAFLAMTRFIDQHTNLALHRAVLAEKEAKLRHAIEDGIFFIHPHRGLLSRFKRKPLGHQAANEAAHPICDPLDELTYGERTGYRWREEVLMRRFSDLEFEPDLKAYFDSILT